MQMISEDAAIGLQADIHRAIGGSPDGVANILKV